VIAAAAIGAILGWLAGSVLRVRRAHVVRSMRAAGIADPERTADGMYRSLGRGLCELLGLAVRRAPRVPFVACDADRAWLAAPSGAVFATAHTGNWDLAACAAAAERPLTVVTKQLSVRFIDRVWQRLRGARGVRLVQAGGAARTLARALGRGERVAMIVDQAPERARATVLAPFLGRLARVDLAPALVAARARVPLIAVFARRCDDGAHVLEVAGVCAPPARPSRAWAEEAMRQVTAWLDAFVRAHPEQWLWLHRRWKGTLPGDERAEREPRSAKAARA
jgi:Kdo2-lipid IVA lauroyltransferase/acyltransferase